MLDFNPIRAGQLWTPTKNATTPLLVLAVDGDSVSFQYVGENQPLHHETLSTFERWVMETEAQSS